jgi:hypothetical protein
VGGADCQDALVEGASAYDVTLGVHKVALVAEHEREVVEGTGGVGVVGAEPRRRPGRARGARGRRRGRPGRPGRAPGCSGWWRCRGGSGRGGPRAGPRHARSGLELAGRRLVPAGRRRPGSGAAASSGSMPSACACWVTARTWGSNRAYRGQALRSVWSLGKAARTRRRAAAAHSCAWSWSSWWRTTAWTSRWTLIVSVASE